MAKSNYLTVSWRLVPNLDFPDPYSSGHFSVLSFRPVVLVAFHDFPSIVQPLWQHRIVAPLDWRPLFEWQAPELVLVEPLTFSMCFGLTIVLLVIVTAVEYFRCVHLDRFDLKSFLQYGYLNKMHTIKIDSSLSRPNKLIKAPFMDQIKFIHKSREIRTKKKTINFSDKRRKIKQALQIGFQARCKHNMVYRNVAAHWKTDNNCVKLQILWHRLLSDKSSTQFVFPFSGKFNALSIAFNLVTVCFVCVCACIWATLKTKHYGYFRRFFLFGKKHSIFLIPKYNDSYLFVSLVQSTCTINYWKKAIFPV